MSTTPPVHDTSLSPWDQILARLARALASDGLDTWFRPLRCTGFDGHFLYLQAPNEIFQQAFLTHYASLLKQAAAEVCSAPIELHLRVDDREPDNHTAAATLPVVRAVELQTPSCANAWLVEQLWTRQAVGVIGGCPKSGKTWLALDLAVSVASGTACLDTFPVACPGPVLLFAAEDSATALRSRMETIAHRRSIDFAHLDVRVITAASLRLDQPEDQQRLLNTVTFHRPVLLVLDPLIRIHAIDENVSGQVAALLGYLRALQRSTGTAVAVVHHVRKSSSSAGGAGYSLRGSSDLYAWLDSFLYLRRHHDQLLLAAEHRSAPSLGPWNLELAKADSGACLRVLTEPQASVPVAQSLAARILNLLSQSPDPQTADSLRSRLQVRNERIVEALRQLAHQGRVQHLARGYALHPQNLPSA